GASDAAKVLKEMNSILPPADLQLILADEQISGDFGLGSSIFADAGPDLFAKIRNGGASFKLDGTASFDPRGASLSYFWSEVNTDGSTGAVATNVATSAQPTFTVTGIASNRVRKTYRLTVRDANTGRKSEDDVFVLLEADRPPVVLVPRFLSVPQNETFAIDALDSFDPEGFDSELTFALTANGAATNQQVTTGIFELSYPSKGRQDLLLTVTADTADGGTAVS